MLLHRKYVHHQTPWLVYRRDEANIRQTKPLSQAEDDIVQEFLSRAKSDVDTTEITKQLNNRQILELLKYEQIEKANEAKIIPLEEKKSTGTDVEK
jgi:hypothetical protein